MGECHFAYITKLRGKKPKKKKKKREKRKWALGKRRKFKWFLEK